MLKNSEDSEQTLLKKTLFYFYFISTPLLVIVQKATLQVYLQKNRSLSQMKGKMNFPCKLTSRKKVFILFQTKPTPLNFISMGFRIFCNSQNLKEISLKVYHFYKSTSSPFVLQPLHVHYDHSKIKGLILLVLFWSVAYQEAYNFVVSLLRRHMMFTHCFVDCTVLYF